LKRSDSAFSAGTDLQQVKDWGGKILAGHRKDGLTEQDITDALYLTTKGTADKTFSWDPSTSPKALEDKALEIAAARKAVDSSSGNGAYSKMVNKYGAGYATAAAGILEKSAKYRAALLQQSTAGTGYKSTGLDQLEALYKPVKAPVVASNTKAPGEVGNGSEATKKAAAEALAKKQKADATEQKRLREEQVQLENTAQNNLDKSSVHSVESRLGTNIKKTVEKDGSIKYITNTFGRSVDVTDDVVAAQTAAEYKNAAMRFATKKGKGGLRKTSNDILRKILNSELDRHPGGTGGSVAIQAELATRNDLTRKWMQDHQKLIPGSSATLRLSASELADLQKYVATRK